MGFEGRRIPKAEKPAPSPITFEGTIDLETASREQLEQYDRYLNSRIAGSYLDPDAKKEFEELQEEVRKRIEEQTKQAES